MWMQRFESAYFKTLDEEIEKWPFGMLYKASHCETGATVCVKQLDKDMAEKDKLTAIMVCGTFCFCLFARKKLNLCYLLITPTLQNFSTSWMPKNLFI